MTLDHPIDRLSGILEQFMIRAELHHVGALCGVTEFPARDGQAYLHVLRRGELEVRHPGGGGLPKVLRLEEPTLLLYPRPLTHHFHTQARDGSDFTCARLNFRGGADNPLVRAMPALIALPLNQVEGLHDSLALLFSETERVRCGQRLLADRLFDVVVIQLLRWLLDNPRQAGIQPGLITGLSNPRLARALVAVHESLEQRWTVERMAACAGMSRTAFAATFRDVVGQTPVDYLNDCRIALAQEKLRTGQPIKTLAEKLGYSNPSALSRAFKTRTGLSPREWLVQSSVS